MEWIAIILAVVCGFQLIRLLIASWLVYITFKKIDAAALRQEREWEHAQGNRRPVSYRAARWRAARAGRNR
jgi:threonine/homoserine/homoserine lactone efflux protein